MSYGIRVWGADGALQLDENSFTIRIVASFLVTFSGSTREVQNFPVPGINTANAMAVLVPIGSYDERALQHEAQLVDGAVNVYNYIYGNTAINNISRGTMRLMVVRFA